MTDNITYFTTILSVIRANFVVFPISPRNSAQAVAHLILEVGVDHILVGHDPSMQNLVEGAMQIVKASVSSPPSLSAMPLFEDLYRHDLPSHEEQSVAENHSPDKLVMYLHSSGRCTLRYSYHTAKNDPLGSTAYPKPIPWTNHRLIQLALIPWFGEQDLCNRILSLHITPMYHGMGICQMCWSV